MSNEYGTQQRQPAPAAGKPSSTRIALGILGVLAAIGILIAVTVGKSASSTASSGSTITFIVTGDRAQVTYGPAGSNLAGTVPMRQAQPLGNPLYYAIDAQLQGGGEVTCQILIDGSIIAQSVATGGYNIAACEVSKDPLTGQWSSTQGG